MTTKSAHRVHCTLPRCRENSLQEICLCRRTSHLEVLLFNELASKTARFSKCHRSNIQQHPIVIVVTRISFDTVVPKQRLACATYGFLPWQLFVSSNISLGGFCLLSSNVFVPKTSRYFKSYRLDNVRSSQQDLPSINSKKTTRLTTRSTDAVDWTLPGCHEKHKHGFRPR